LEFPFSITASLELSSAADDVENILTGLYWFCASTEKTDSQFTIQPVLLLFTLYAALKVVSCIYRCVWQPKAWRSHY